jgi:hypothetical protein
MNKVIASAGLLALGAVGVQTVQAQWTAGSDKSWSVSATLRGFYDDNYNTQPDGTNRVGSYGFEVRPSLKWNVDLGPTTIDLSYVYALKYYDARPNNKYDQDHDFEVFLNHNFNNRYSIDFSDSFVIDQEPEVIDPTLSSATRANGNNIRNSASINFHAELTPLLGMVLGYGNTFYSYDQNTREAASPFLPTMSALLDRDEHRVSLDSRWHIWEETTGIFGYTFGAVDYTSSESIGLLDFPAGFPLGVPSSSRNNYSHSVYVGAEHNFSPDLFVSGRGGIEYLDYYEAEPGNVRNTLSPWASLSLNYAYMDGGSVSVGFNHSHNQTDQGANAQGIAPQDQESSSLFGTITQRLTPISPDLTATLSGQYQNSTFNGGGPGVDNQSDNIYLFGLNLSYQFTRYISGEVGYNYDLLSSDLPGRGYNRNRVYVGVTASY